MKPVVLPTIQHNSAVVAFFSGTFGPLVEKGVNLKQLPTKPVDYTTKQGVRVHAVRHFRPTPPEPEEKKPRVIEATAAVAYALDRGFSIDEVGRMRHVFRSGTKWMSGVTLWRTLIGQPDSPFESGLFRRGVPGKEKETMGLGRQAMTAQFNQWKIDSKTREQLWDEVAGGVRRRFFEAARQFYQKRWVDKIQKLRQRADYRILARQVGPIQAQVKLVEPLPKEQGFRQYVFAHLMNEVKEHIKKIGPFPGKLSPLTAIQEKEPPDLGEPIPPTFVVDVESPEIERSDLIGAYSRFRLNEKYFADREQYWWVQTHVKEMVKERLAMESREDANGDRHPDHPTYQTLAPRRRAQLEETLREVKTPGSIPFEHIRRFHEAWLQRKLAADDAVRAHRPPPVARGRPPKIGDLAPLAPGLGAVESYILDHFFAELMYGKAGKQGQGGTEAEVQEVHREMDEQLRQKFPGKVNWIGLRAALKEKIRLRTFFAPVRPGGPILLQEILRHEEKVQALRVRAEIRAEREAAAASRIRFDSPADVARVQAVNETRIQLHESEQRVRQKKLDAERKAVELTEEAARVATPDPETQRKRHWQTLDRAVGHVVEMLEANRMALQANQRAKDSAWVTAAGNVEDHVYAQVKAVEPGLLRERAALLVERDRLIQRVRSFPHPPGPVSPDQALRWLHRRALVERDPREPLQPPKKRTPEALVAQLPLPPDDTPREVRAQAGRHGVVPSGVFGRVPKTGFLGSVRGFSARGAKRRIAEAARRSPSPETREKELAMVEAYPAKRRLPYIDPSWSPEVREKELATIEAWLRRKRTPKIRRMRKAELPTRVNLWQKSLANAQVEAAFARSVAREAEPDFCTVVDGTGTSGDHAASG